ncbi:riboflavin synthase [Desulfurella sp.]|uniref:riboflavin synthase n=1 Tax=Desulfurella sp. TaxID=1962857 RepID=UPI0003E09F50|nr:riboflavin synthase subunit alpha [Desulfurella acetivorans A63]
MFTGIVEEVGKVKSIREKSGGLSLFIEATHVLDDLKMGDSIAVNGACLTCTKLEHKGFWADVSKETLDKTNLKYASVGEYLNLERALKLSDRLSGHIVLGHVDCAANLLSIKNTGEFYILRVQLPKDINNYVILKGSVCVDGMSLTVSNLTENYFEVAVIPHTFENTTLKFRKPAYKLNIEADYFGKFIEKYLKNLKEVK